MMMLTVLWRASLNTMEDVDVTLEDGADDYRRQAAVMSVLSHEDKKAVINEFKNDDLEGLQDDPGCDVINPHVPGFPYKYVVVSTEGPDSCLLEFEQNSFAHYYLSPQSLENTQEQWERTEQVMVVFRQ